MGLRKLEVSGTTDANGFLETSLDSATNFVVNVTNFYVDNVRRAPYFYDVLLNATATGTKISLIFHNWNGVLWSGAITVTVWYMEM